MSSLQDVHCSRIGVHGGGLGVPGGGIGAWGYKPMNEALAPLIGHCRLSSLAFRWRYSWFAMNSIQILLKAG